MPRSHNRGHVPLTPERLEKFLYHLARTGNVIRSCDLIGCSRQAIDLHRKKDPVFAEEFENARARYAARLEGEIDRRGVTGYLEPVFAGGGKNPKEIVGHVRKFSDRMLEIQAKRHIREYRDKIDVDANVRGGVLVVPAGMTVEEWTERERKRMERADEAKKENDDAGS